jgi:redox-sensitive bicupin YhaK (pirin superfamily)
VPIRPFAFVLKALETRDGAGVKLRRAFGDPLIAYETDPFLLLDDFGSRYPHEYLAGFPWHPHRGFETVTYIIKGEVHHEDSTGIKGVLRDGDVQWMTAGSGIFHSEMPKPARRVVGDKVIEDPEHRGLQLWVNLPSRLKLVRPHYRNLRGENVPSGTTDEGVEVRVIAGEVRGLPGTGTLRGPVTNVSIEAQDVSYLELLMPGRSRFEYPVREGYTALAYVLEGEVLVPETPDRTTRVRERCAVVFEREGDRVVVEAGELPARLILLTGRPIGEPIAWYGPIVMNTKEGLIQAFKELREGSFVKHTATEVDDLSV